MHSEWIFNQIESLKIKKKINLLDFASGDGRNCIPLSKQNINVTAIDIDREKLNKYKSFKKINETTEEFETKFWNSKSAETFYNNLPANIDDPMALVFKDAMQNLLKRKSKVDLNNRMTTMLETGIEKQMSKISKGFTFLATVGSTAPFIGLFGTVWGIMNSFQSIAISRNTSLAIVAPGIAEALFATALGLLAAIPAVVAYNKFNYDSIKYSQKLENFSKRFLTII